MNIHDMQFVYVGWGEVNQSCESGRGAKKGQDAERGQYRQWYLSSHKQTRAETLLQPPSPPPNDSVLLLILCISITSHFSLPFMRALIMLIQHSGSFFFFQQRERPSPQKVTRMRRIVAFNYVSSSPAERTTQYLSFLSTLWWREGHLMELQEITTTWNMDILGRQRMTPNEPSTLLLDNILNFSLINTCSVKKCQKKNNVYKVNEICRTHSCSPEDESFRSHHKAHV